METFDFPYFTWSVNYPESSAKVQFGRGWEFASRPRGPDQVKYTLHFKAMWFYESSPGVASTLINPQMNIAVLEDFYMVHQLYEPFILPLPGKGNLTVRFSKPLGYKLVEGGRGQVEPFDLEMILQP